MRNLIALIATCFIVNACGSINTIGRSDKAIITSIEKKQGNCKSIPRIYSGVNYNLCLLKKKGTGISAEPVLGLYFMDIAPSALADTLAIPYTAYDQYKNGSIPIKSKR